MNRYKLRIDGVGQHGGELTYDREINEDCVRRIIKLCMDNDEAETERQKQEEGVKP